MIQIKAAEAEIWPLFKDYVPVCNYFFEKVCIRKCISITTIIWLLGVVFFKVKLVVLIFQLGAIRPLLKNQGPTKWWSSMNCCQTSNGANSIEMWYYSLLIAPDNVFICCYFLSLQWSRGFSGWMSWTFSPQPTVKLFSFFFPSLSNVLFLFYFCVLSVKRTEITMMMRSLALFLFN